MSPRGVLGSLLGLHRERWSRKGLAAIHRPIREVRALRVGDFGPQDEPVSGIIRPGPADAEGLVASQCGANISDLRLTNCNCKHAYYNVAVTVTDEVTQSPTLPVEVARCLPLSRTICWYCSATWRATCAPMPMPRRKGLA